VKDRAKQSVSSWYQESRILVLFCIFVLDLVFVWSLFDLAGADGCALVFVTKHLGRSDRQHFAKIK
jgi:hypothetical protein